MLFLEECIYLSSMLDWIPAIIRVKTASQEYISQHMVKQSKSKTLPVDWIQGRAREHNLFSQSCDAGHNTVTSRELVREVLVSG